MFHNTHAHFSSKLYDSDDSLLLIGSFLPDIAITKIIDWEKGLHDKETAKKFLESIREKNSSYAALFKGIYSHCILDDFTHHKYKIKPGYAYQNNQGITALVEKFYDLESDTARKIAHNYIESGVEILLLPSIPDIPKKLEVALQEINTEELAELLSSFFHIEENKFLKSIILYFELVKRHDLRKKEDWVSFWSDLNKMRSSKEIEGAKIMELLEKSVKLVKDSYREFLDYSFKEARKELEVLPKRSSD